MTGHITGPQGQPVSNAQVDLVAANGASFVTAESDASGAFTISVESPGIYTVVIHAPGFAPFRKTVELSTDTALDFHLSLVSHQDIVTVTADVKDSDILFPDPAQRVFVRDETLDANPGRPGAPISIPGLPIESASGGIKAPQYFAPGVAGDHGEPIAQYLMAGTYLIPNNLSANAHGNGYADPNIMIPQIIESVQTDGGAFNVREGNHSVNVAAIYGFRQRLEPYVTLTADYRDLDLTTGWSPADPQIKAWFAIQVSYGNGFLDRLEHRQQYKFNGFRVLEAARHDITLLAIGYYGISRIPGLVPIDIPNLHDNIDPRQRDQTFTGEIALNDVWHLNSSSDLQLSSYFRSYNLALFSNFGDGLIRQSEFRTVVGGNANYVNKLNNYLSVQTGLDYFREAPRRDNLDRYASTDPFVYGPFQKVTANNVTLNFVTPYISVNGALAPWIRYNLGWRRDQIDFNNTNLLNPVNSFQKWVGVNSPKATLTLVAPQKLLLPSVSFSFGQTFFTNDPRIGTGSTPGTPVSRAHSLQMILTKTVLATDFRVTLGRVTQETSLAKIDPDTGLQQDEGASRNYFVTFAARHYFHGGMVQASFSKADARDLSDGTPVPEAPRTIFDVLGTIDRLPFHLQARAEFEEVGRKPLGDGFVGVPVKEFRGALSRRFVDGRVQAGINFLIASGYSGQTTEVLALPGDAAPFERVVGVYIASYASASLTYHFRPRQP